MRRAGWAGKRERLREWGRDRENYGGRKGKRWSREQAEEGNKKQRVKGERAQDRARKSREEEGSVEMAPGPR